MYLPSSESVVSQEPEIRAELYAQWDYANKYEQNYAGEKMDGYSRMDMAVAGTPRVFYNGAQFRSPVKMAPTTQKTEGKQMWGSAVKMNGLKGEHENGFVEDMEDMDVDMGEEVRKIGQEVNHSNGTANGAAANGISEHWPGAKSFQTTTVTNLDNKISENGQGLMCRAEGNCEASQADATRLNLSFRKNSRKYEDSFDFQNPGEYKRQKVENLALPQ